MKGKTTMNRNFILKNLFEAMNERREISLEKFEYIFPEINESEYEEIISIMAENHITLTETADDEKITVNRYMGSVEKLVNLTNEELCSLIQDGNEPAKNALILKNQNYVYKIAAKYKNLFVTCKLDIEDLTNIGFCGLINAANRFDYLKDCRFITYCHYYVKGAIIREIADNGYTIRIPAHIFEVVCRAARCRSKYPFCTKEELIKIFVRKEKNMTFEKAERTFYYLNNILRLESLSQPINEDEDTFLGDMLEDRSVNVEEIVMSNYMREEILEIMRVRLSKREFDILCKRLGFYGRIYTLEEIGFELGVTRERIRQIESKALRNLRFSSVLREFAA